MGSVRSRSLDSFCSVINMTCGLMPQAWVTVEITVAASRSAPPGIAVQYWSAGWGGTVVRRDFRHQAVVQFVPLVVMKSRIWSVVIEELL